MGFLGFLGFLGEWRVSTVSFVPGWGLVMSASGLGLCCGARVRRALGWVRRCLLAMLMVVSFAGPGYSDSGSVADDGAMVGFMREALASHPSVSMRAAELEASEYGYQRSRWEYFPTPILSSSTAWRPSSSSGVGGGVSGERLSVGVSQPLWTGGRLTAGSDFALAGFEEAVARLEEASLNLVQSVLSGVGEWKSAYLRREAWRQNVRLHNELRLQMERRLASGVASQSDLALAVSRYEGVAAELLQLDAEVAVAKSSLERLVGRELADGELLNIPVELFSLEDGLSVLVERALEAHPAMQVARAEIERRRAEYSQVRAERFPSVRLELRHREFYHGSSDQVAELVVESGFGPGLSIVSAGQQAMAKVDAVRANLDEQRNRITELLTQDYLSLISLNSQIDPISRSVLEAESVLASYRRQYLAGQKSWLDVLNSAREVASTKARLTDAVVARMVASWRLALNVYGVGPVLSVDLE